MFWKTDEPHDLPRNPFKACVVPRPIGWISTVSADGVVNLAPYSFFNAVCDEPPMVMFAGSLRDGGDGKDSATNAETQGEFVVNIATWDLREEMNTTSAGVGPDVDETQLAGLETAPSALVTPPRVASSPIHLECVYHQTVMLPDATGGNGSGYGVVFGRVVGLHISDAALTDGLVDLAKVRPIARLGYMDYARVDTIFAMGRPKT